MENEEISIIAWYWLDLQTNATRLRVVSVATGEEVHLNDASFLVRISINAKASVIRCYIRHLASGREAYMQSGLGLRAFVKDCLLNNNAPESTNPDTQEEQR